MIIRPASGDQHRLDAGGYRAEIASVGASVRSLTFQGRPLIVSFDADEVRPAMRGALLAPWPNRTEDGTYDFAGSTHQLPINEISTNCAIHGLAAWLQFVVVDSLRSDIRLVSVIEPQPGYPWRVRLEVDFWLDEQGLRQEVTATNEGDSAAPFGAGGHPYLVAGVPDREAVDNWELQIPAETVLKVTADRSLPGDVVPTTVLEAGQLDFRGRRLVGGARLNHAFTDLRRNEAGVVAISLVDGNGQGAQVSWDERCGWVQVYTSDAGTGVDYRHAIAVEPMTCPPDALNSKRDLWVLEPGESASLGWTISGLQ